MIFQVSLVSLIIGLSLSNNEPVQNYNSTSKDQPEANEFGLFLSILSEIRVSVQTLKVSMKNYESRLIRLEHQNMVNTNQLRSEIDHLRESSEKFQNEVNSDVTATTTELATTVIRLSENVESFILESRSQFPDFRTDIFNLQGKLRELRLAVVTDIRLEHVEEYSGKYGYLLQRFNYPTFTKRARIQKLVNGSWKEIANHTNRY